MVKGYKTINIKEELIEKIRNLDENKKEVEDGRFNLAGFFANAAIEHIFSKGTVRAKEPIVNEVPTMQQIKNVVTEALSEKNSFSATSNQEGPTHSGLSKEDLAAIKGVVGEAIAEAMH